MAGRTTKESKTLNRWGKSHHILAGAKAVRQQGPATLALQGASTVRTFHTPAASRTGR